MTGPYRRGRSLDWYDGTGGAVEIRRDTIGTGAGPESFNNGPAGAVIRPLRSAELPALCDLDQRVFGPLAYPFFVLRQLHDVHGDDLLVLDEHGVLLGYSLGVRSATPGLGWVLGLGIDAAARGRGYGERLARATIARLARCGIDRVRLTVRGHDDSALSLYRRLGFAHIEEIPDYFGPGETRVLLEARLPDSDPGQGPAR